MSRFDDSFDPTFQSTSKKINMYSASERDKRLDETSYDNYPDDHHVAQDFSKEELVRLIVLMEGELEGREQVIDHLKKERTKILLAEAKYGKLSVNDPFSALRRDSAVTEEYFDEQQIGQMYESQVAQLDRLIATQRKLQNKSKLLLSATEKRHLKAMRELEAEMDRKSRYADQGDDVLALLEKERNKLTQQVEYHIEEAKKRQGERDAAENKLAAEKKRHEAIVLYLIQERKHMLLKIHELRCKTENAQPSASTVADRELIEELKKEVTFLRGERESLKNTQKMLKSENLNLKEVVKGQEADLLLLRKNLISTAKITMEKPVTLPQLADDRALVVANRGVTSGRLSSSTTSRLSTSSSFPMEKSRLPRAPITSVSTTNSSTIPRHSSIVSPRTIGSPTKKTPIMGVSSARRPQSAQQHLPAPTPPNEPEFDELEAAIQSMNVTATSSTSSSSTTSTTTTTTVKRSSSLPRDRPTSSLTQLKRPDVPPPPYKLTSTKSLVTSSPTTSRAAETRKLSGTVKRNGILAKAFGK